MAITSTARDGRFNDIMIKDSESLKGADTNARASIAVFKEY